MSARREIRSGAVLGPYVLGEPIGTGASAVVHAARDAAGREVAVKVRRRGHPEMDRRFLREFESMRLLRVRGVVQVHDAGFDEQVLWFSMDRIDGRPLQSELFETLPPVERVQAVTAIGVELMRILASLHEAGFVHRDIKPTNVLVGADHTVHVLDFGIGRYFGDQETLSDTGEVLGTVPYMSPEQLSGLPVDEKVDLFAAGLMLHEALAGPRERPTTTLGWIPRICLERLAPLATLAREVPLGLSALVDALLSVDPRDRPTARGAMLELHRVVAGVRSATWPEPPFVDPGPWWQPIQGCIGNAATPAVWVLEGAVGSGRRRLAEQLHRTALLHGTWTLHLHCRVDRVGGPVLELLEVLEATLDDEELERVLGPATAAIRQMGPHLPLPWATSEGPAGDDVRPDEALAQAVADLCQARAVLLVVHDLERIDPFTASWLPLVARHTGAQLGILLLHEVRWSTPLSRELVTALRRDRGAGVLVPQRHAPEVAERICAGLVQGGSPDEVVTTPTGSVPKATFDRPAEPRLAVEAGWKRLAAWRSEPFSLPEQGLWSLAVLDAPLPTEVFRSLAGADSQASPWLRVEDGGIALHGPTARFLVQARMASLKRSASALGAVWEQALADRPETAAHLATLWLLAGDTTRAWSPAARAAVLDERVDLWSSARQWLLLLDTLLRAPASSGTLRQSSPRDPDEDFELAWVQARVALYTDAATVRPALVEAVDQLARTAEQEQRARVLGVEYQLRLGQPRPALVAALRVGSQGSGAAPHLQVAALLLAVRARITLRQLPEALRELERAEGVLAEHPETILAVRVSNVRAELALMQDDLLWCRALCQKNIRSASQQGYVRGVAEAAFRLGLVLRMLGRRREAEHHVRSAREAYATTGDASLGAESGLALATLLVERGEGLPARHLLDQTILRIRGLSMHHLLPVALRLALQVATLTGDGADGSVVLAQLDEVRDPDPETAAALVRWWRTRGDLERALAVPGPLTSSSSPLERQLPSTGPASGSLDHPDRTYAVVAWRLERSRVAISAGRAELAEAEARWALDRATDRGFAELQTYAQLVIGTVTELDEGAWTELQARAATSMWTEVFLGALEMDARRLQRTDAARAGVRWTTLLARARELGYRPGVEEATGWLPGGPG